MSEVAMINLFYILATNFLALICLTSALARTIQKPDPFCSTLHWIFSIAHAHWFPVIEYAIGATLVFPLPVVAHLGAAIAAAMVVGAGLFARVVHPEEEYEGFGSITPASRGLYFALAIAVLCATLFIAFGSVQTPGFVRPFDWRATGATIVIVLLAGLKLLYDKRSGTGYAHKSVDFEKVSELPANLVLGTDEQGTVTAGKLAAIGKPCLILAISPHSTECRNAHALLAYHAKLLAKELTVVVIAPHHDVFQTGTAAPLRQLVDPGSYLSRYLAISARPYAILIDTNLALQSTPSRTSHTVQRLITLLVGMIKNAPETLLSVGEESLSDTFVASPVSEGAAEPPPA